MMHLHAGLRYNSTFALYFKGGVLVNCNPSRVLVSFVMACLAAVTLAGCGSKESSGDAMAKVNGKKILRADVEKYYRNQTAQAPQQPSAEEATSLRLAIIKQLIDDEIMLQKAEKLGLLATEEEVDSKLNEVKAPYTQEQFDQRLKERGLTLEDLRREFRRNITIEKVINKEITSKITISDADISSYYNAHKAEFNLVEPRYHLAQIVVTASPNPESSNLKNKALNPADARKKIQMVENRLDSGEDFATVAMNYSEDPSTAGNGGDMGFIPESAIKSDPTAREIVSRLKAGQNSPVIPVADPSTRQVVGYRIVKLLAREPAGQRELNDPRVQQAIREQLRGRREQLLKAAYYEVVRDEAKVENYYAEQVLKNSGK
ncbi:MAG TPA: SurA N-terminal domain-containing protein [Terriglobales bacterium]|jgi:peptidyl-prolyl cis-trans isomerase SurA|nr:SurA N-terminal domain-containing protein [Terriglobales bacterium]